MGHFSFLVLIGLSSIYARDLEICKIAYKDLFRVLHDILKYNKDTVKFINSGVRIFSRTEAKVDAPYRITQEGVNTMKSFCQRQNVTTHSLEDVKILLENEHPNVDSLRFLWNNLFISVKCFFCG